MKFTEGQKQKICDYIEQSLNSAELKHIFIDNGTDNRLPLVDLLCTGDDISGGQEEITNIVEQIYFDIDEWDI